MDSTPLKDAFWNVVTDCLHDFHGVPCEEARRDAQRLRHRVEVAADAPAGYDPDLFYHAEPFHVAEDLAGRKLDASALRDRYEAILAERFDPAERATFAAAVDQRPIAAWAGR